MSLIKFNNRQRLFPSWTNEGLKNFLSSDDFFNNDFFEEDSLMPAMNVKEHDDDFEIEFAAPGFNKKDFEVTIDDNILNVCGEKKHEAEEKEEDFTRKEFSYNSFKRSMTLPKSVNTDQEVKATYKNGILKLNLLKKEEAKAKQPKKVEVI
ncbi:MULTISPECIES: Hsp20/alpha crystallin family protein [Winogradskyella]|jgi:HSP20 family protein|uniref:Hsp20/alpha crystallin family protein n=1 Tax=Winogradskyella TaxID=286104 RepID=UPI000C69E7F4|nr:Hsp20/alpha crystallin family protein [Winogradskyella sp. MH6]MAB48142.1 heat-shock protein [Flavobacteriaceae bacterium]MBD10040.1 heat-shock protein [Flavobacteriaceae bacterium]|tara:strand:- start:11831 stop:12283 length:453 start_codon:yes stop_codon:yes gene_type:complete